MADGGVPSTEVATTRVPMLQLTGVSKRYDSVIALHAVDLGIENGEFVTLLGPSGSGKSTLLNLIAGIAAPTSGRIFIAGRDATTMPASERGLGMVFQNYALMPHMTVFENIAFPLQVRRVPRGEIKRRVHDVLDLIQLRHLATRRPRELSGGQQQRVSLARCIVYNPGLILMDEPLGALDKKLREQMQLEIKRLHAELGITMLYVTHDQDEALTMSDRIVLMNAGKIEQQGSPDELYFRPCSVFAADFIGSSNLIAGTLAVNGNTLLLETAHGLLPIALDCGGLAAGERAVLLVRPENITLAPGPEAVRIEGKLEDTIIMAGVVRHFVRCADGTVLIVQELNRPGAPHPERGQDVTAAWHPAQARLLPLPEALRV